MARLADLQHLPRPGDGRANFSTFQAEIAARNIQWPSAVIEQFLFDHGCNHHFVEQYGHLDLEHIEWTLKSITASELSKSTYHEDLGERLTSVAEHPHDTLRMYRSPELISRRGEPWNRTWAVPPVLLSGELRDPPQAELHLVEGHTRMGVLIGLLRLGEVEPTSEHLAYVGSRRTSNPDG